MVAGLLVVYDFVASQSKASPAAAFRHGRDMLGLTPFDLERRADHWLAGVHWLHAPAAYYYDLAHIDVTMAVLVGCWVWRSGAYRRARNGLVAINLIGLATFFLYPVAPPRLLPDGGFVDIVADSGTWGSWEATDGAASRTNEFGSMPSLHTAWAVWVALTVWSMTPRPVWRWLAWGHVAMTVVVVVFTGNHYVIDLLAGAATAVVAWALAGRAVSQEAPSLSPASA